MFKLPKVIVNMIDAYRESLGKYLSGEITSDRFRGIRVPYGFYSQRGGKILMARVRIPGGSLSPDQLMALAVVSERFNLKPHITDRQDIQLHNLRYEDSAKLLEFLKDYQLSTIGGGGNTVRNVTACYLSGICRKEMFDVTKFADSLTEYLLKEPASTGKLPRKYKVAFSGCPDDCAYAMVNDVGLIAKIKDGVRGFRVYCGGGMGANSAIGQVLEDFITPDRVPYVVKAVMLVFNKYGDRLNRHKNRLRFLIQDKGFETFKNWYKEELKGLIENEYVVLRETDDDEIPSDEPVNPEKLSNDPEFKLFIKNCLHQQKQMGNYFVELHIKRGDISAEILKKLAGINKIIPLIRFRTTQFQNLLLCNVPGKMLFNLFEYLKTAFNDAGFLNSAAPLKIVACKGAATCNLGICNSPGLVDALVAELKKNSIEYDSLKGLYLKISGCPNNCGQHVLGTIGLQGMTRKVNLRPVPLFKVLLGGSTGEEKTRFGTEAGIVPARSIPSLIINFLKISQEKMKKYKDPYEYLDKEGSEVMNGLIKKYSFIPDYEEDPSYYRDWGRTEDFSLAGIGPGECGAGVIDLIEADLSEAERVLNLAREKNYSADLIRNALVYSARALQVVKGLEPKTDLEVVESFIKEFVNRGIIESRWQEIREIFEKLTGDTAEKNREEIHKSVSGFYSAIRTLYKQMDPNFRFPAEVEEQNKPAESGHFLDLKGVACPYNYVKAKLFMEPLDKGSIITLYLDEGEPIRNVPQSLKNDGHEVLEMTKIDDNHYKLVVRKN